MEAGELVASVQIERIARKSEMGLVAYTTNPISASFDV
jgi:hypothetical protein